MSVLFSELLVPGWADEKIGLDAVTGTYSDGSSFNLPCHTADPELFFSEAEIAIAEASPSAVGVLCAHNVLKVRYRDKSLQVCGAANYLKMDK